MTLSQTLTLLSPELILTAAGLIVLGCDLIWREERQKGWLPYLALLGVILAFLASLGLWGQQASLLSGTVAVDAFALFFKLVATLTTGFVILAAVDYLRERTPYRGEFYGLLLFCTLAMTLMAAATDLIMLYLSIEFLSLTSYILAGFLREDEKSNEASIKYFLYGAITSATMLYGMSLLYGATGTTSLNGIAQALATPASPTLHWLAFPAIVLLLAGFGFKMALVPFHQWSPDTYEGAPTPFTAFLSVGPKAMGFAILMRVFLIALPAFQVNWIAVLVGLSMVTMTLGNLVALQQTNIKRLLAYSSIAHAGYILIGFVSLALQSTSSFTGVNGVLIYLLAYLFTNLGAFLVVIAVENATGSNQIEDYAGLAQRAPVLAAVMLVFLFSLAGIPGTGGFLGKFFVFGAAIQVQFYLLALVAILNSVVAAYYYLNVVKYMFFLPVKAETNAPLRIPTAIGVPLAVTVAMTLVIGLYPQPFIDLATSSVTMLAAVSP